MCIIGIYIASQRVIHAHLSLSLTSGCRFSCVHTDCQRVCDLLLLLHVTAAPAPDAAQPARETAKCVQCTFSWQ